MGFHPPSLPRSIKLKMIQCCRIIDQAGAEALGEMCLFVKCFAPSLAGQLLISVCALVFLYSFPRGRNGRQGCRQGGRQMNIYSSFSISPLDFSLLSILRLTLSFSVHLEVFIKQTLGYNTDVLFFNSHHICHVLSDVCSMAP